MPWSIVSRIIVGGKVQPKHTHTHESQGEKSGKSQNCLYFHSSTPPSTWSNLPPPENRVGLFFFIKFNNMCDFDVDNSINFMRITKRRVDPITFSENYDVVSHLEDSLIDQTYYQGIMPDLPPANRPGTAMKKKKRRFSDDVEIFIIPDLDEKSVEDMFYSEEDVANFRHEAFLESCGLSSEDFSDFSPD